MRTTAILNLKGGVAKTVTVVNMAAILARIHRKRVLVVDADAQGNTTEFLGGCEQTRCCFADLLRGTEVNPAIRESSFAGVDLLPADDSLMDLDLSSVKARDVDAACLLKKLRGESYDFVLIDCPPAFNAAAAAALIAADDVVIPIKLDAFSIRGMANLTRQIRNMKKINPGLRVAGVLPTMWYASDTIKDAERKLRLSELKIYPHIRQSKKVDDSTFAQRPLIFSSPRCGATVDYKRFVARYLDECGISYPPVASRQPPLGKGANEEGGGQDGRL